MAHHRKSIAAAVAVNTTIFAVEGVAGLQAQSVSLAMDAVHNFSDELALVFLFLAFVLSHGISRNLVRSANIFNSVGLVVVSALLIWEVIHRLFHPQSVIGWISMVVGLAAAAGNWWVARLLREPGRKNPAIRLAYIHNLGDVYVSLAPVAAGILVAATGMSAFDALVGLAVAVWVVVSTAREVVSSHEELIWPGRIECGHDEPVA